MKCRSRSAIGVAALKQPCWHVGASRAAYTRATDVDALLNGLEDCLDFLG